MPKVINDKHMAFCTGRRSEVPMAVSKDKMLCIICSTDTFLSDETKT